MIHAAALALYIAAFLLWLRALLGEGPERRSTAAMWLATVGLALHLIALVQFTAQWQQLPLTGLGPSLSTLAFLTGVGLLATLALGEASRVGILVVPLMIVLEGIALLFGIQPVPGSLDFQGTWFTLHVILALASLGAVALSAAAGVLYLLQFRELKSGRPGHAFHFLPPLTTLDRVARVGMVAGFVTLTVALVLGWAWTLTFRGSFEVSDPQTLWGVFVWVVIVATIFLRRGERGERRGAVGSIVAFGLIVLSYALIRSSQAGGFFL